MQATTTQSKGVVQNTKKYIIDTARGFFSEYSYLGVSMSDIAKKLNITKAALYYHFTGKAEIYEQVLEGVFDDLSLAIKATLNETTVDKKLYRLIKNYLDFGFKEKNLVKAFVFKLSSSDPQITRHIIQLREQVISLIQPIIEEVSISKKLTKKIDSKLLTSLLTSMMDGLLLEYSFLDKRMNSGKVSDQIITLLFQ